MPDLNIGGQAVIEGVMMRSSDRVSTAVRVLSGEIIVKSEPYRPLSKRYKILKTPILRGAVAFLEMMVIGIRTLNFSAEIAMKDAEKAEAEERGEEAAPKKSKSTSTTLMLGLTVVFALLIGVSVFFFLPLAIATLTGIDKQAMPFNLMAGAIRLTMFIAYVWGISRLNDFKRIFQYHGAEHKSIYAYEMGDDLTPEVAARHTRFHPRCGTSFVLIVALLAIMIYAVSDSFYTIWAGHPPGLLTRFGIHFSLLPLVSGISFELLKLSGKTRENPITRFLIAPGLWLQRITTNEPSHDQIEVAIAALESALGITESKLTSPRTPVT